MDVTSWIGHELRDHDGESLGRVAEVFLDQDTRQPRWAAVESAEGAGNWRFAPLIDGDEDVPRTFITVQQLRTAPAVQSEGGRLTPEQEDELRRHYETTATSSWVGRELRDRDGQVLGRVAEVFLDEETRQPKWAAVESARGAGNWRFVPLPAGIDPAEGPRTEISMEQLRTAPHAEVQDNRLTAEQERVLLEHYRARPQGPAAQDAETRAPGAVQGTQEGAREPDTASREREVETGPSSAGGDVAGTGPATLAGEEHERQATPSAPRQTREAVPIDQTPAMIRSEEELVVAKEAIPRERVRFVKRVVTETVTRTVEVRREELHIERIPVQQHAEPADTESAPRAGQQPDTAASGRHEGLADQLSSRLRTGFDALQRRMAAGGLPVGTEPFNEETVDVTLMQEEVVVSKRVVPRERVRIRRHAVVESRQVSADLRKEQVEIESVDRPAEG